MALPKNDSLPVPDIPNPDKGASIRFEWDGATWGDLRKFLSLGSNISDDENLEVEINETGEPIAFVARL